MSTEIKKAKADKWVEYLADADASTMWNVGKMVKGEPKDGGRSRIPEQWTVNERGENKLVGDNIGKAKIFRDTFFPPPPAESRVPRTVEYPAAAWEFTIPTDRRLKNAIHCMKNGKATRMGTIPNDLFKACSTLLVPRLGPIYRATYNLRIYPDDWALNETIVLKKPGQADYRQPSALRPVAISEGHGRLMNGDMAAEVTTQAETLGLLALFDPLEREEAYGFMDDVAAMTWGENVEAADSASLMQKITISVAARFAKDHDNL
ncbi:hypothetical protein BT96DRAFT_933621 [Gymnopus androsaceus JB14]|uniref:Uncharacterized protein n=1 Tax=Gymnopus androsaceus JB14 TaxID=1447944 RepID=A0A6A4IDR9_9AGAR|nr:hypothetical protein BT96DRAFT_933621 [Gymnopus androsaceus JB14]